MPTLLLLLATIIWGASFIAIKVALQEVSPVTFIMLRFGIAALCLLPGVAFLKEGFKRQDLMRGTYLGLFLGGVMFLQTLSLQTVSASVSAFLTGFMVVFVLILRFVAQRKLPHLWDMVTALACVAGLGLVTGSYGVTRELGVLYALSGALFMALHTYLLSIYTGSSNILVITLVQMAVLALSALCIAFASGSAVQIPTQSTTWVAIMFCAVFCSAINFWIQAYAQQYLSAFETSMILTLEPVFATIFSCLLLGEELRLSFYIGASIMLASIVVINWRLKMLEE